jgi:predicted DNA-binding transcriptional regulator YafY
MVQEELKRFERTLAILIMLQSKRLMTAHQLSERFGVSLRTIYRDIRSLEAAGVPVIGEAGAGYSIMEGYRLPPVMFSREEASSFVAAEKLMQKFTDAALGSYFQSAMNKVKSVLKGKEKDWVEALEKQVWSTPRHELFNKNIPNALEVLFSGIGERKQVYLEYRSLASEVPQQREIEPVGVFHENDHWYLFGYCHLRKDYRQFRTDRIVAINRTDKPFTKEHGSIDDYRKENNNEAKTKVIIAVDKSVVRYIGDGKKYYGFVSQEEKDDEIEMVFMAQNPMDGLARWYMMFGDYARVIEPDGFRQRIKELAEKNIANLSEVFSAQLHELKP